MLDLEISTCNRSIADHGRTEGTNSNKKFTTVVVVPRDSVVPEQKQQRRSDAEGLCHHFEPGGGSR